MKIGLFSLSKGHLREKYRCKYFAFNYVSERLWHFLFSILKALINFSYSVTSLSWLGLGHRNTRHEAGIHRGWDSCSHIHS